MEQNAYNAVLLKLFKSGGMVLCGNLCANPPRLLRLVGNGNKKIEFRS